VPAVYLSFRLAAETVHHPRPAEGDQPHAAGLPRLEPHRGAGGDVEPAAARYATVEGQRRVGLGEVVMAADLNGPVPGVADLQLHAVRAGIQLDLARGGEEFTRDHGLGIRCTLRPSLRCGPPRPEVIG
jgi:hypothetical protein